MKLNLIILLIFTTLCLSSLASAGSVCTTTRLNVRSDPCVNSQRVGTVSKNHQFSTAGNSRGSSCYDGYSWLPIYYNGNVNYVANYYVRNCGGGNDHGSSCSFSAPEYHQWDSRWGNDLMGDMTISDVGCVISSVSMGLAGWNRQIWGHTPTPGNINQWLRSNNGYSGNLLRWSTVNQLGARYLGQVSTAQQAQSNLCDGHMVILRVRHGGHWVLATGVDGDRFLVNDPGYNVDSYRKSDMDLAAVYAPQ
eukprot:gb/GECH01004516.1/.p1 GENE.gb/GECH01004516.1/~~gb/GECH01004516.1/.p1  ORF type:complete len:250 (+),score=42.88 gb/GECH01004516.1/:1-750(+)